MNVGGPASYALIADGKVIVTASVNNNTQLIALDQATGATIWGPIQLTGYSSTTYEGGKVFVLSASTGALGTVQSYDIESGARDWTVTLNADVEGGLTALNGLIYTSGDNGLLFALSEATGSIVWSVPVINGGFGAPAVTSTGVYVSYPCSTYDFQPLTGAELFYSNTGCERAAAGPRRSWPTGWFTRRKGTPMRKAPSSTRRAARWWARTLPSGSRRSMPPPDISCRAAR